jgi:hypothetical protein
MPMPVSEYTPQYGSMKEKTLLTAHSDCADQYGSIKASEPRGRRRCPAAYPAGVRAAPLTLPDG